MKIDGIIFEHTIISGNVSDRLSRLNIGDVIKCRVMNITSGSLLLKLLDGSTFTASQRLDIDVRVGDMLTLQVKNKEAGQIILELLKTDSNAAKGANTDLADALSSLNIKADKNNLEIARELKAFGIPLAKDVIETIAQSLKTFENLSAEKAAYLYANKLPIDESNINSLNQLSEGKFNISSSIEILSGLIEETKNTSFYKALENDFRLYELFKSIGLRNYSDIISLLKSYNSGITNSTSYNSINVHDLQSMLEKLIGENVIFKTDRRTDLGLVDNYSPEEFKALLESYLSSNVERFKNLPANEKEVLLDSVYSAFKKISAGREKNVQEGNYSFDNKHDELFTDHVRRTFRQMHVSLDSKNLSEELNIKKIYRDILSKIDIIKSRINEYQDIPGKEIIAKVINDIEGNIKFMNELYSHTVYVQLPINMWNNSTTGELYILRKKSRKKKISMDEITVFISLNTNSLGCVDTLLGIKGKNVSLNVSTESREIADFIKSNYKMLYDSLISKGFKLIDMKCRVREKERNLLQLHKEMIEKNTKLSASRLDLRV